MNGLSKILFSILFTLTLTVFAAAQQGQNETGTPMSNSTAKSDAGTTRSDATFIKKAAQGGMAEVELGQLAVQKASSQDVKNFGQRMVDDHTKANDELKQVAADQHVTLPQALSMKDKATKARLEKLSGQDFDRAYMSDMVKDHKTDVAEFARESKSAQDTAVKNFAQQTLPTLRDHLKEAERIAPTQQATKGMGQ